MAEQGKVAILVGGGPAPGINSVIGAATIRCRVAGIPVVGVKDGFSWLMRGDERHVEDLEIETVSRIHFRGGSMLGTSRANPTREEEHLANVVTTLHRLGVNRLITIGGDDTAYSAHRVSEKAGGTIRVVHVPKTIDNDLCLPSTVDTFGFQTARHLGVQIIQNIMVDAETTSRWYFAIAMGRKAGHLALGIGKAAGATLTLVPEEFGPGPIRLRAIVDTLVGSIVKRLSMGQSHGVVVVAEGVVLGIADEDLAGLEDVERDDHGHLRIAEVSLGDTLKGQVQARLKEMGLKTTIVAKNIGYELRCADPIPFDMEYTRDLGYCAAKYLIEGGSSVMITLQGGAFVPIPFEEMLDPETGRTRVRMVDIGSTGYAIARRYMIRLRRDDFADEERLERIARSCWMSVDDFRGRFGYLADFEPPRLRLTNDS